MQVQRSGIGRYICQHHVEQHPDPGPGTQTPTPHRAALCPRSESGSNLPPGSDPASHGTGQSAGGFHPFPPGTAGPGPAHSRRCRTWPPRPGFPGGCCARLMVGGSRNMGTHGRNGITVGGSLLNGQSGNGVGVVAAPNLGMVSQHSCVEPSAAARASLEQHIGEFPGEPLQQIIQPQHIAVGHLSLSASRQGMAVQIRQMTVHVPLDIINGVFPQKSDNGFIQPLDHILRERSSTSWLRPMVGLRQAPSAPSPGGCGTGQSPR